MGLLSTLKSISFAVLDAFGAVEASKLGRMISNLASNVTNINELAISESDLNGAIKDGKHLDITAIKTADYTIDVNDEYIRFSTAAAHVTTLPNTAVDTINVGKIFIISDSTGSGATHNISMLTQGDDLINGATSKLLNNAYGSRIVMLEDIITGVGYYKIIGGVF